MCMVETGLCDLDALNSLADAFTSAGLVLGNVLPGGGRRGARLPESFVLARGPYVGAGCPS